MKLAVPSCIEPQESEILASHLVAVLQLSESIMSSTENTILNKHTCGLTPGSFDNNAKDVQFYDFDHASIPLEAEEWPVIIIGSSMAGMMTGLLGYHGYNHILLV